MPTATASQTIRLDRSLFERIAAERARRSLHRFVREAWPLVEPGEKFRDGWHIRAICEHLEAVTRGEIEKLRMHVPPGHSKSLLVSVFWPCWEWTRRPAGRWWFASHGMDLVVRDSLRRRMIITSDWYRRHWPEAGRFIDDQNQKLRFQNAASGWMYGTTVGGQGTGEHPDRIVVDDPHDANKMDTEAELTAPRDWWQNKMATRGVGRNVKRVCIMQRLHEEDFGKLMDQEGDWATICLPLEWEPDRMPPTPLGWQDPRTQPGELLWPELFGPKQVAQLKNTMTLPQQAGQLQQRPPNQTAGSEWPRDYFQGEDFWFDEWPDPQQIVLVVQTLDPSLGKTDKSDYSAIITLMLDLQGIMWIDADLERRDSTTMLRRAFQLGALHQPLGFGVESNQFQELLAGQLEEISRAEGFALPVYKVPNSMNKLARIRTLTPYFARRDFRFKKSHGSELLVGQLRAFPHAKHDDGPDALEMAVRLARQLFYGEVAGGQQSLTGEVIRT